MTLDRVCVSTWAYHTAFEEGKIRLLDFPEMIAEQFGVHNLEIVAPHFGDTDRKALEQELRRTKSRMVNIPVDIKELWETPSLSSPDEPVRQRAIGLYSAWIDRAAELGVPSVRCDPGLLNLADLRSTIESYRTLVAHGAARNVEVSVENHGSAASHPEQLAEVLRASGAAALPDFGNFPDDATRARGLRLLFPLAKSICHAKLIPSIRDCVAIAEDSGFRGVYSIESADVGAVIEALLARA
jgi:sugar phosphate isomerase/epimerase